MRAQPPANFWDAFGVIWKSRQHQLEDTVTIDEPEGFIEISRWLSAQRDTTGQGVLNRQHPEGVPDTEAIRVSTYLSLHYHLVFSTKNREPLIRPEWLTRLHEYLGGTVRGLHGVPEQIGGIEDHVHLLVGLKATHCLSDFMRELKKHSSGWVHDELHADFAWQEGYAAFTVSPTAREAVRHYIAHQAEHHRKQAFREELIELLEKAGIEYDPRYLD